MVTSQIMGVGIKSGVKYSTVLLEPVYFQVCAPSLGRESSPSSPPVLPNVPLSWAPGCHFTFHSRTATALFIRGGAAAAWEISSTVGAGRAGAVPESGISMRAWLISLMQHIKQRRPHLSAAAGALMLTVMPPTL